MARSRQNRYLRVARQMASKYGLPERLFLSMVNTESGWNPSAISSAGAIGLGQLMPGTARGLGVDPFDPKQNLDGAARYLKSMFERTGNWKDALRAYNQGPNGIGDPSAGLDYAEKVLSGRSAYARIPRAAESGGSRNSSPNLGAPARLDAPPGFDMKSLAQLLFADDPEFLPFAQSVAGVSEAASIIPGFPTMAPGAATADAAKQPEGYKGGFDGKVYVLPTQWKSTHPTSGLEGFDGAVDLFPGPAGTPVGAPEDGVIIAWDPDGAQGGGRIRLRTSSGYEYWIGHIDNGLAVGTRVKRGQPIAVVSSRHSTPHVHIDRRRLR